jgi:hypothetical protein
MGLLAGVGFIVQPPGFLFLVVFGFSGGAHEVICNSNVVF